MINTLNMSKELKKQNKNIVRISQISKRNY